MAHRRRRITWKRGNVSKERLCEIYERERGRGRERERKEKKRFPCKLWQRCSLNPRTLVLSPLTSTREHAYTYVRAHYLAALASNHSMQVNSLVCIGLYATIRASPRCILLCNERFSQTHRRRRLLF